MVPTWSLHGLYVVCMDGWCRDLGSLDLEKFCWLDVGTM